MGRRLQRGVAGTDSVTLHTGCQENIWESSHFNEEVSPATLSGMRAGENHLDDGQVAAAVWAIRQTVPGTPQERLEAVLDLLRRAHAGTSPAQP